MNDIFFIALLSLFLVSCKQSMQGQCEDALMNKHPVAESIKTKDPIPLNKIKLDAGVYEGKAKTIVEVYYYLPERERTGSGMCFFDSDDNILNPNLESCKRERR